MLRSCTILALAALSSASELVERGRYFRYPPKSSGKAFYLVANVTNSTRDLDPPVQGTYLNAVDLPPPYNLIGVGPKDYGGRLFYLNGTRDEACCGLGGIVSDGSKPLVNQGISINFTAGETAADKSCTMHLDVGEPKYPVHLSLHPNPYIFVNILDLAVCDEHVAYVNTTLRILKYFPTRGDEDAIPAHCVPVRLLPECAHLNALGDQDIASHKHVRTVRCYKSVLMIKWRRMSEITSLELPTHGPF